MYRASLHHRTTTLYVLIDHVQSVQKLRLHTAHDAKIQLHGRLAVPMPRDVLRQTQRYTFTYIIQHPNTQACIYECITGTHTHTHTHTGPKDHETRAKYESDEPTRQPVRFRTLLPTRSLNSSAGRYGVWVYARSFPHLCG